MMNVEKAIQSILKDSFLGILNQKTNLSFDLPTEAQWEYACRAGTTTAYYNGTHCLTASNIDTALDTNLDPLAYYGGNWNWEGEDSHLERRIGTKEPNHWGIYDMLGHVWEYCLDWYDDYSQEEEVTDPVGPLYGKSRVSRGGSWHAWPSLCRSGSRHFERGKFWAQGFRVICNFLGVDDTIKYMVVDLSSGVNAKSFPVTYLKERPADFLETTSYKGEKLLLRRVVAGQFLMGSPLEETGRDPDERQHQVTLTKDFFVGIYLVSQKQWELVKGNNPSAGKKNDFYPVESITWDEVRGGFWPQELEEISLDLKKNIQPLCQILTEKTGYLFDLPTEAQWEYACRAGTKTAYFNGKDCLNEERGEEQRDENLEKIAWYGGNWSFDLQKESPQGRRVGLKEPNGFGLYDMHGQVWEYCLDWYAPYPEGHLVDPTGPSSGAKRVVRGGSWHAWPAANRSSFRSQSRGAFGAQGVRVLAMPDDGEGLAYMMIELSQGYDRAVISFLKEAPEDLLENDQYRTTKLLLRKIPAGTFTMGSPKDETGRSEDEVQHQVTLTKDFYLGIYPVTQKQWELIMGYNNSVFKGDMLPVDSIDWEECRSEK